MANGERTPGFGSFGSPGRPIGEQHQSFVQSQMGLVYPSMGESPRTGGGLGGDAGEVARLTESSAKLVENLKQLKKLFGEISSSNKFSDVIEKTREGVVSLREEVDDLGLAVSSVGQGPGGGKRLFSSGATFSGKTASAAPAQMPTVTGVPTNTASQIPAGYYDALIAGQQGPPRTPNGGRRDGGGGLLATIAGNRAVRWGGAVAAGGAVMAGRAMGQRDPLISSFDLMAAYRAQSGLGEFGRGGGATFARQAPTQGFTSEEDLVAGLGSMETLIAAPGGMAMARQLGNIRAPGVSFEARGQMQMGLQQPETLNRLLSFGINARPGGRPQTPDQVIRQIAQRTFGGRPTAGQVGRGLMPGMPLYQNIAQFMGEGPETMRMARSVLGARTPEGQETLWERREETAATEVGKLTAAYEELHSALAVAEEKQQGWNRIVDNLITKFDELAGPVGTVGALMSQFGGVVDQAQTALLGLIAWRTRPGGGGGGGGSTPTPGGGRPGGGVVRGLGRWAVRGAVAAGVIHSAQTAREMFSKRRVLWEGVLGGKERVDRFIEENPEHPAVRQILAERGSAQGDGPASSLTRQYGAGEGGSGRGPSTANKLIEMVKSIGIPFKVTSKVRPGAKTRSGNLSYHATGHAIDISSDKMKELSLEIARKYGKGLEELIYTPGANLRKGSPHTFGPGVKKDHYDHIHVAATAESLARAGGIDLGPTGEVTMGTVMAEGAQETAGTVGALSHTGSHEEADVLAAIFGGMGLTDASPGSPQSTGVNQITSDQDAGMPSAAGWSGGKMDPAQIAKVAYQAGFRGNSLITAVAIAMGESTSDPGAVGDEALADAKWGPSIGLWQIRTLRAQRGTGKERDINRLMDPSFNAQSAYSISGGGTNFRPWTVYKEGIYKKYLAQARSAVMGQQSAQGGVQQGDGPGDAVSFSAEFGPGAMATPGVPPGRGRAGGGGGASYVFHIERLSLMQGGEEEAERFVSMVTDRLEAEERERQVGVS